MSQPETAASGGSTANAAQITPPASGTVTSAKASPSAAAAEAKYGFRARFARFQQSRPYRGYSWLVKYRRRILVSASVLYLGSAYASAYVAARKRDKIHDSTYLYWKIYDGSIVEAKTSASALGNLLFSSPGGSDEPPRVMTLFEVIRTLNWAMMDDRVKGIVADFSSLSQPIVQTPYSLGLAQIEEISDAIEELNKVKAEKFGSEWRSIAITDTFDSQSQYTLATAFNEIYMQPTGEVPLTGVGSQLPFFKRLIDWLGIKIQAEAREEYKSFIAQYTEDRLTEPQTQNQTELLHSLNNLMLGRIAKNRYERPLPDIRMINPSDFLHGSETKDVPMGQYILGSVAASSPLEPAESPFTASEAATVPTESSVEDKVLAILTESSSAVEDISAPPDSALERLRKMSFDGPFSTAEAAANGLITGSSYRSYIMDSITDPDYGGKEENKLMGFYHYFKLLERGVAKSKQPVLDVGVVYLLGTIGETGEYDAASVVRGLRQAGEDEEIGCVVLRIDSGGGGVVDSDSIDQAVRDLREKKGKVVIASFANAAASGGYLSACHTDAIIAHPATITGSIGVAALRPTITPSFLDKIKISVQSILTGSPANDLTQELSGKHLEKHRRHVDETYQDFKNRVVEGRDIHPDLINSLAGGRVYTGQMAFDLLNDWNMEQQKKLLSPTPKHSRSTSQSSGVQLMEGQEMSPFAIPSDAETASDDASDQASPPSTSTSEGSIEMQLGPLGRGIIDGLGGIREAAALAAEVFLTQVIAETKLESPDMTDVQVVEQVMPGIKYSLADDGKLVVPLDVALKQFPLEKTFWERYREATSRGDAMTDPQTSILAIPTMLKVAFASWILSTARKVVSDELDGMGLADVRRSLGIGYKPRGRAHMRAEAPRWTFQT